MTFFSLNLLDLLIVAEADLGLLQHPRWSSFVIIVNGFQPLTIITKSSILDVAAVLNPPLSSEFAINEQNILDESFQVSTLSFTCCIKTFLIPFEIISESLFVSLVSALGLQKEESVKSHHQLICCFQIVILSSHQSDHLYGGYKEYLLQSLHRNLLPKNYLCKLVSDPSWVSFK